MHSNTLRDFLTAVIAERLPPDQSRTSGSQRDDNDDAIECSAVKPAKPGLPQLAEKIADELVKEAVASGLPLGHQTVEKSQLGGGNTAEVVAKVTLHAPFAFKLDHAVKKLGEEGLAMRKIKGDTTLPPKFRDAWPVIYAVRHESPPYAYLMEFFPPEDGWRSLEDRLYPAGKGESSSRSNAVRSMTTVLDVLFAGFEASVDVRHRPNLREDYLGRIRKRLEETAQMDSRFSSRALLVNGQRLRPWKGYLDEIERNHTFLNEITPPFISVTHGDPNPGNLMLRTTTAEVELKLIDPKEWMTGDYLFDIAKITHFVEGTGPVEKPMEGEPPKAVFQLNDSEAELTYGFGKPSWTEELVEMCTDRVKEFAAIHQDPNWRARYELGMAANLLGLPLGRLKNGRNDAALILFGEGLKWLDLFCARLGSGRNKVVGVAKADEVEPAVLKQVRTWVKAEVKSVREAQDKRGFQLLQWDPVRPNDAGKPAELSLEHEARSIPADEQAAARLLEALSRNEGLRAGEHLLKNFGKSQSTLSDLIVRRYARGPGPQSLDRYYDVPAGNTAEALIPRMITVRERLRGSKFMTWSTTNEAMRPLNLELPFVYLGDSGMTARLEFNWIDDLQAGLREALAPDVEEHVRKRNPLFIAQQMNRLSLTGLVPVLEHTTYRQKFGLWQRGNAEESERELFVINMDSIVAQDLETNRIGTYWDVDISSVARVDKAELRRLTEFVEAVASRYGLQPHYGTKAWRDAQVTGRLAK